MSQRIYDLSKLDFEGNRRRKRKKLLIYSLPLCVMAFVTILKLLGMNAISAAVNRAESGKDYVVAEQMQRIQRVANLIEPHLADYNLGNLLYRQKKWSEAIQSYRRALVNVPEVDECRVRINLTLALIGVADSQANNNEFDQAILTYDEAKSTLNGGSKVCGVMLQEKTEEEAEQEKSDVKKLKEYLEARSSELKIKRNKDEDDHKGHSSSDDSPALAPDQLEQIKEIEERASRTRAYRGRNDESSIKYGDQPKQYW